jgi:hypothetical protein
MGCGGTVNRLLVDKIEEGIVQNFWKPKRERKRKKHRTPNIEHRTPNAQRPTEE